jgi:hypothetical protein
MIPTVTARLRRLDEQAVRCWSTTRCSVLNGPRTTSGRGRVPRRRGPLSASDSRPCPRSSRELQAAVDAGTRTRGLRTPTSPSPALPAHPAERHALELGGRVLPSGGEANSRPHARLPSTNLRGDRAWASSCLAACANGGGREVIVSAARTSRPCCLRSIGPPRSRVLDPAPVICRSARTAADHCMVNVNYLTDHPPWIFTPENFAPRDRGLRPADLELP